MEQLQQRYERIVEFRLVKIGVDLTYNNTAFWSAYINHQSRDA